MRLLVAITMLVALAAGSARAASLVCEEKDDAPAMSLLPIVDVPATAPVPVPVRNLCVRGGVDGDPSCWDPFAPARSPLPRLVADGKSPEAIALVPKLPAPASRRVIFPVTDDERVAAGFARRVERPPRTSA